MNTTDKRKQNALNNRKRLVNMRFTKSGSGSPNAVIGIPIGWCEALGITKESREVTLVWDGDKIILTKRLEE